MDLPTYTNIWRIEKRLYKLYDFRLPMPLPVGQITVFAAIALPYVVLLTLLNVPFSHSLVWLYVLPPGLATWLVTRPVLEGKRLPELVRSQLRYLAEPRVWCRMAPLAEKDLVVVTARVWRLSPAAGDQVGEAHERGARRTRLASRLSRVRPAGARPAGARPASAPASSAMPAPVSVQSQQRRGQQGRVQQPPAKDHAQPQPQRVQARSGRPEQARAGAASARAARAAAVRARATGSAPAVISGLSRPVASARPAPPPPAPVPPAPVPPATALPGSALPAGPIPPPPRPASPLVHPPVRPVPPDEPVVLRDRPSRAPTAPPTRSPAPASGAAGADGSAQAEMPVPRSEPLSIPRPTASPDAAPPPIVPPVPLTEPKSSTTEPDEAVSPIGSTLAPAPHGEVMELSHEAPVQPAAGPETSAGQRPVPARWPHIGLRSGPGPAPKAEPQPAPKPELAPKPAPKAEPQPAVEPGPEAAAFSLSDAADREPVQLDASRRNITVVNAGATAEPAPTVERMLAGPSVRRGDGVSGRVMVVPGGHRPGKPDQLQRDRARAQLPISGPRRVVVLGCTVGAGQTMTSLLTGEVLASLRSEPIAALDLNPGASSLLRRGRLRPALAQVTSLGSPKLAILGPTQEAGPDPADAAASLARAAGLFERATDAHRIVLADPSTTVVPRLLSMADQLILVAPASAAAARAIGMTFEWLDAHGHADLASEAIMVMNGVSRRSTPHVEQAERGCIGRCRAIVRVPWDDQLGLQAAKQEPASQWAGAVSPATAGAYTALAGVLVVALADQASPGDDTGDDDNSRSGATRAGSGWGPR